MSLLANEIHVLTDLTQEEDLLEGFGATPLSDAELEKVRLGKIMPNDETMRNFTREILFYRYLISSLQPELSELEIETPTLHIIKALSLGRKN